MKKILKKIPYIIFASRILKALKTPPSLTKRIRGLFQFLYDYGRFSSLAKNPRCALSENNINPRMYDKTDSQGVDYVYFYQDAWCARKVFTSKPKHHVDIGSKAEMVGIISELVPSTMVDIRPLELTLPNLAFQQGNITELPFEDNSVESLSSICVIEHIGLGRYGDDLDSFGTEKAVAELKRILSPNGNLYISVPIDSADTVYFNAHRAFRRDYILALFSPLSLIEEKYIYGKVGIEDKYDPRRGFGTGLFHFKKI